MQEIHLERLKWPDVEAYLKQNDTVILPVGATEQHGLHLPLGTDSLVAIELADQLGAKTNTLVAPPIWYGWSPHHLAYPGTISLRPETLTELIVDCSRSLIHHGFKKILIINGHRMANLPPIQIAATRVRNQTGALMVIADPFYVGELAGRQIRTSEPGGVGHADELETSHMLHLLPELCDMSKAVKNMPAAKKYHVADPYVECDRVTAPSNIASYRARTAPSGVSGDPTVSSAEKGRLYNELVLDNLYEVIEDMRATQVQIYDNKPLF
ncbi:MAG: creatininase family protein [Bacillota bacterium]